MQFQRAGFLAVAHTLVVFACLDEFMSETRGLQREAQTSPDSEVVTFKRHSDSKTSTNHLTCMAEPTMVVGHHEMSI